MRPRFDSQHTVWFKTICNYISREPNTLFGILWALNTGGIQIYIQGNHTYVLSKKGKKLVYNHFVVRSSDMFLSFIHFFKESMLNCSAVLQVNRDLTTDLN